MKYIATKNRPRITLSDLDGSFSEELSYKARRLIARRMRLIKDNIYKLNRAVAVK